MSSFASTRSDDSGNHSVERPPIASHPKVDRNVYTAISVSDEGPCDKAERAEESPGSHPSTTSAAHSIFRRLHSRWVDGWAAELMSCALSIIAMASLVATLWYFDGRVITEMPLKISINTLVAIFAGITKSSLLLPVAECISQSKWLWYSKARRLIDFENFDLASRGPWGSLLLLFRLKHRHVAILGAWITLLALAIDPFTQQIIHPVTCDRAVFGTLGKVPRAGNLTSFDDPIYAYDQGMEMSMLASIYTDLIEGDRPIDVQCPTGNCTFTQKSNPDVSYQTLGFESACVDVSKEVRMQKLDEWGQNLDKGGSSWYIPRIATNVHVESANTQDGWFTHSFDSNSSANSIFRYFEGTELVATRLVATMVEPGRLYFPEYWTAKQNGPPIVSFTTLMFKVDKSNCEMSFCQMSTDMALAVECGIWPAILTIQARIESAKLYETTVNSEPLIYHDLKEGYPGYNDNWDAIPAQVLRDGSWEPCTGSSVETPENPVLNMTTWYAQDCVWTIEWGAVTAMRRAFNRMYQDQTLILERLNRPILDRQSRPNGEAWLKSLYHNGQSNLTTVEAHASKIARAITKQTRRIRASRDPEYGFAKGTVMETATCVQVRWAWIILPASLIAFTMIFLATTIWKTWRSDESGRRYGIWKSSSLAVLLGGLQDEARGSEALEKKSDMEVHAKEMKVSLRPVNGGWRLG